MRALKTGECAGKWGTVAFTPREGITGRVTFLAERASQADRGIASKDGH